MTKLPGEGGQQPEFETLVQQAYEQIINPLPEEASLPLLDRVKEAVGQLPDPGIPTITGIYQTSPIWRQFAQFGPTLLSSSPSAEELTARAHLLFHPDMREHYASTARASRPPHSERLVYGGTGEALDLGIKGLAGFTAAHPNEQQEAIHGFAAAFRVESSAEGGPPKYAPGVPRSLASKIGIDSNSFRLAYATDHFNSRGFTDEQRLIADVLVAMEYGKAVPGKLGIMAVHEALYSELKMENLLVIQRANMRLADQILRIQAGQPISQVESEFNLSNSTIAFENAHNMLRRLMLFVSELGSENARRIAGLLPELTSLEGGVRYNIVAIANGLTEAMNEAYFANRRPEHQLQRLDASDTNIVQSVPQAFDRLLYLLRQEAKVNRGVREGTRAMPAGVPALINAASDNIHLFLTIGFSRARVENPVTVADIIAMHPDMPAQQLTALVNQALDRFRRASIAREPTAKVYNEYKDQVNNRRTLYWKQSMRREGGFLT